MDILWHLALFLASGALIWGLSGFLVSATDRVAKRYNKPGFAVAFFVLGVMTSVSEMSVAVNATIEGVPQVSAGNLIGGSLVIFLLIIPILAVMGNGIPMNAALGPRVMAFLLTIAILPSLFALDGGINRVEGLCMILLYGMIIYVVQSRKPVEDVIEQTVQEVGEELLHTDEGWFRHRAATTLDVAKIIGAGVLIFFAGKLLVDESIFFSQLLSIPASLVGLVLLSIGTNAPELVIAIRCVVGKHKDIAFGDYMGSAGANTLLMGGLALANGSFGLERTGFIPTFVLLAAGLVLFFVFSRTKNTLSRREGAILLGIYVVFLLFQMANVARLAEV